MSGPMLPNFTPADQLLYTTVNLQRIAGGEIVGSGTGFFYRIPGNNNRMAMAVITNKHIVDGCDALQLLCHLSAQDTPGPSGELALCSLDLQNCPVLRHPDAAVDLCAISFSHIISEAEALNKRLFMISLERHLIPSEDEWGEFDSVEEVVMVGCPRGLFDEVNNIPIVRRGITATLLGKKYNGRDEFMVDMACFPGSSGSPVMMLSRDRLDRKTGSIHVGFGRPYLLGVLYSGPVITNEGKIVLSQQPRVEVAGMMHLGQVIRSTALLPIEQMIVAEIQKGAGSDGNAA